MWKQRYRVWIKHRGHSAGSLIGSLPNAPNIDGPELIGQGHGFEIDVERAKANSFIGCFALLVGLPYEHRLIPPPLPLH